MMWVWEAGGSVVNRERHRKQMIPCLSRIPSNDYAHCDRERRVTGTWRRAFGSAFGSLFAFR